MTTLRFLFDFRPLATGARDTRWPVDSRQFSWFRSFPARSEPAAPLSHCRDRDKSSVIDSDTRYRGNREINETRRPNRTRNNFSCFIFILLFISSKYHGMARCVRRKTIGAGDRVTLDATGPTGVYHWMYQCQALITPRSGREGRSFSNRRYSNTSRSGQGATRDPQRSGRAEHSRGGEGSGRATAEAAW